MFKKIDKQLEHIQPFEYICSDGYVGSNTLPSHVKKFIADKKATQKEQEIDLRCFEASITGKNNGGLVGSGVATAAGAAKLSNVPIIGFLLEPFARNRAQKIGSNLGSDLSKDLSDC